MSHDRDSKVTMAMVWGVFGLHVAFVLGYAVGSGETTGWPYGAALLSQIALTLVILVARHLR